MPMFETTTTSFASIGSDTTIAYRWIGAKVGVPLVMHMHYRGNMDFWDPALVNGLAKERPVVVFDQSGVGRSGGVVSDSIEEWASVLIRFVRDGLRLNQIDLLGFSMGGGAAQMVAIMDPKLVRRLILAGTTGATPAAPPDLHKKVVNQRETSLPGPIELLSTAGSIEISREAITRSFFNDDTTGRSAADAYFSRISQRSVLGEPNMQNLLDRSKAKYQMAAFRKWTHPIEGNSFERLAGLKMQVLVCNGDNDKLIPSSRSWELMQQIPHAQLMIYPNSGHGFLYQHSALVAKHVTDFLSENEVQGGSGEKL